MTQGKHLLANKTAVGSSNGEGQTAAAPPSYEEATAGSSSPCYSDAERLTEFTWEDKNIRRIFIRKVYAMLMIQLFVTMAVVAVFTFWSAFSNIKFNTFFTEISRRVYLHIYTFAFVLSVNH